VETAALLVGYVVGRGNQDVVSSESPELHRISSILESLRKQLCGDQNMEAAIEKAHELGVRPAPQNLFHNHLQRTFVAQVSGTEHSIQGNSLGLH